MKGSIFDEVQLINFSFFTIVFMLMDSVCKSFVKNFCFYVHKEYYGVFFSCNVNVCVLFQYQRTGFIDSIGKCFLLLFLGSL